MIAPGPTIRQLVEGMALGFDPSARDAGVLELAFTGDDAGTYQLLFGSGACRFARGTVEPPTLRIETSADTWRAIAEGRVEPLAAVLDGRLAVQGDLGSFQRLRSLFRPVTRADLRAPAGQRAPGPVRLPAMAWLFVGLLPWKAFWVATALHATRAGIYAGLVVAAIAAAAREASGGSTFLERCTVVSFGAASVALLGGAAPAPGLIGTSFLALAAIWAASLVRAPQPLTAEYARWNYVPRLWSTGLFRHPNALLTLVWACIFGALAVLAVAGGRGWMPRAASTVLAVALCAAGGVFTHWHERGARERRIPDLDRSLARLDRAARALLVGLAPAFFLIDGARAAAPWMAIPAAACLVAALRRAAPRDVTPARGRTGAPPRPALPVR